MLLRTASSGLVLAEQGQDQAAVSHALKQMDDRLVLQWHPPYWKVFRVVSDDHPAVPVVTWMDEQGNPLPLSSGLITEVQKWRPEARGRRGPDADERNRQLVERIQKEKDATAKAVVEDHQARLAGRITVSLGTRPSRRYWQRNRQGPASGGLR